MIKHKILIIGGAGYVGTSLIELLLCQGHTVRVFDNLMSGGSHLVPFFAHKNFEFQKGDIKNLPQVKRAVLGQDFIVHLAAIVGYPACKKYPELAKSTNITGTKNIVLAAKKNQPIIFASTGSVYGAVHNICTEESPVNPLSLYGETKLAGEKILLERGNSIIFRFATGFGVSPHMRLDLLVNDFAYRAFTQGRLVVYEKNYHRTFIHVKDMARAFAFGIENFKKMKNNVFNVGSEKLGYTKKDICDILKKSIQVKVEYNNAGTDQDKRDYVVSYKKINKRGYTTTIDLNEGINGLIEVFKILGKK